MKKGFDSRSPTHKKVRLFHTGNNHKSDALRTRRAEITSTLGCDKAHACSALSPLGLLLQMLIGNGAVKCI